MDDQKKKIIIIVVAVVAVGAAVFSAMKTMGGGTEKAEVVGHLPSASKEQETGTPTEGPKVDPADMEGGKGKG
ncbi:MAG: hypothetical protein JST40_13205 [Armatimonadetes bacterium]|nr:hypothetical protein [Armatimonadota bacterium]